MNFGDTMTHDDMANVRESRDEGVRAVFTDAYARAARLDADDPLRDFRARFAFPLSKQRAQALYMVGNSLGLMPKATPAYVNEVLADWRDLGVEGHFRAERPWMPYHELVTSNLAAVVGALPQEVCAANSLTVNLHLLLASFYRPTRERFKIIIERGAFPSDRYAVVSQLAWHGLDANEALIELTPRPGEDTLRHEDILQTIEKTGRDLALVLLGQVNYLTGQAFKLPDIAAAAHRQGALMGVDLAHGIGNLALHLHDDDVDFAVWCSYKYLNSGPGATAGYFVHARHGDNTKLPRLAGWWGHDKHSRFAMGPDFHAIPGAEGWQLSNPAILPLACLRASLEIFAAAGMDRLRTKSLSLTGLLESLLHQALAGKVRPLTPKDKDQRGAQLSITVTGAGKALVQRLAAADIYVDFREPEVLRLAPAPLYTSHRDVVDLVFELHSML